MSEPPEQDGEILEDPAARRPYTAPSITLLGNLSDLTFGAQGSNFDHGHETPTKRGMG
jgi:hypothetical protein